MKRVYKTSVPFLLVAFVAASILLCCYKPASAAVNVKVPACHKAQKSQTPSQDHKCCKKNMMMQSAVLHQDFKVSNLNQQSYDFLVLGLSLTSTLIKVSSQYRLPISPQKFASISIFLKTHTLRI